VHSGLIRLWQQTTFTDQSIQQEITMFTNVKFEVSANAIENIVDIVELDLDMLNNIGGGDGSTSMPYPGK
jgi:ABC-type uncharacterized transport system fused permease/ATPase subunit